MRVKGMSVQPQSILNRHAKVFSSGNVVMHYMNVLNKNRDTASQVLHYIAVNAGIGCTSREQLRARHCWAAAYVSLYTRKMSTSLSVSIF